MRLRKFTAPDLPDAWGIQHDNGLFFNYAYTSAEYADRVAPKLHGHSTIDGNFSQRPMVLSDRENDDGGPFSANHLPFDKEYVL
jgi:hypothetical protein